MAKKTKNQKNNISSKIGRKKTFKKNMLKMSSKKNISSNNKNGIKVKNKRNIILETKDFQNEAIKKETIPENNQKKDIFIKIIQDLNTLKENKNIALIGEQYIISENNFERIFQSKKYSEKSINYAKHIYFDYLKYLIKIIDNLNQMNLNKKFKGGNTLEINIFSFEYVKKYLDNSNFSNSTKANKFNNLSRTFQILSNNKDMALPKGVFVEQKKKHNCIIPSLIFIDLSKELFKIKDMNFIVFYYLCFIFGLNINEIANIKLYNYDPKRRLIFFMRNKNKISRTLNCYSIECLKLLNKDRIIEKDEYLIYSDEKFKDIQVRENFLFNKLKIFIDECEILTKELKEKLISDSMIPRESRRLNIMEIKNFSKILSINKIIDSTKDINGFIFSHNNDLDSFNIDGENKFSFIGEGNVNFFNERSINDYNIENSFDKFMHKSLEEESFEFKNEINLGNEITRGESKISFKMNIPNDFHESYEKEKSKKLKIALKENNIKFNDNLDFSINPELINNKIKFFQNIIEIEDENLAIYYKMKEFTKKGKYPNLELRNLNEANEFQIIATNDIKDGTLLFEISGEVVSYEYLKLNAEYLKNKKFCYFKLFKNQLDKCQDFVLIHQSGNIAFFIIKSSPIFENVGAKAFYIPKIGRIVLLAFATNDIKKYEVLKSSDIYSNLN